MKRAGLIVLVFAACSGAGPVVPATPAPAAPAPVAPPPGDTGGAAYGGATDVTAGANGSTGGATDGTNGTDGTSGTDGTGGSTGGATYGTPASSAFDACNGADQCVVIFAGVGCVPSDPVAVAKAQIPAFQRTHAHPPPACGIGGRDYEERVRAIRARWGVTCNVGAQRCELVDHGQVDWQRPQPNL